MLKQAHLADGGQVANVALELEALEAVRLSAGLGGPLRGSVYGPA